MPRNGSARHYATLESPKGTKDKVPLATGAGAKRSRRSGTPQGKSPSPWEIAGARAVSISNRTGHVPSHVRACHRSAWQGNPWAIYVWPEGQPQVQTRLAYACNSWRCSSPECQRAAARKDFARIHSALEEVGDPEGWVFVVLTIDRNGRFAGEKPFRNEQEAFKQLASYCQKGLKRLERRLSDRNWEGPANRFVWTVESHRTGWPHVNGVIYAPELARELRAELEQLEGIVDDPKQLEHTAPGSARRLLREAFCGHQEGETAAKGRKRLAPLFGVKSVADAVTSTHQIAGYIAKLAGGVGQTTAEVSKLCQAPIHAKFKLRRIRAGHGFLPPPEKNDGWTGTMVRRRMTDEGDWQPEPVVDPNTCRMVKWEDATEEQQATARARYVEGVNAAQRTEIDLALREEDRPGRPVTTETRSFLSGVDVTGAPPELTQRAGELIDLIKNEHADGSQDVTPDGMTGNDIAVSRASEGALSDFRRLGTPRSFSPRKAEIGFVEAGAQSSRSLFQLQAVSSVKATTSPPPAVADGQFLRYAGRHDARADDQKADLPSDGGRACSASRGSPARSEELEPVGPRDSRGSSSEGDS